MWRVPNRIENIAISSATHSASSSRRKPLPAGSGRVTAG
jgi:hypothetical protein